VSRLLRIRPRESGTGRTAPQELPTDGPPPRLRPRDTTPPSAAAPSRARRFLQPVPLAGALLILIALIGYWSVYSSTTERTPVLVATHDLPAGTVLRPGDLRAGELAGDASVLGAIVPERDLNRIIGTRLGSPVGRGAPLTRAAVTAKSPATSALTLSVPALHALGGDLQPGDRVTVLATFGTGSGQAHTRVIARGLEVLAVGRAPGSLDRETATVPVTVALTDPSQASALALANADAKIDLLLEGGKGRTAPIPPAREGSR
jgi:Flp pilus assembly protein CpaB